MFVIISTVIAQRLF